MTTETTRRQPLRTGLQVLAVTPVLRWLLAHHSVPFAAEPRTHCARCRAPLWPAACGPSGRCGSCRARVGPAAYAVESVAALTTVLLIWSGMRGWQLAAYTWWAAGLAVLSFIDLAVRRLPFRITAAVTAGTILLLVPAGASAAIWWGGVLGGIALVVFYGLIRAVSRGGLGLGDVALAFPVGFAVGWHDWTLVLPALVIAHVLAAAAMMLARANSKHDGIHLPFGPYLAVAALLAVFIH